MVPDRSICSWSTFRLTAIILTWCFSHLSLILNYSWLVFSFTISRMVLSLLPMPDKNSL